MKHLQFALHESALGVGLVRDGARLLRGSNGIVRVIKGHEAGGALLICFDCAIYAPRLICKII